MHGPAGLTAVPVKQDGSLVDFFFEVFRGVEVDSYGKYRGEELGSSNGSVSAPAWSVLQPGAAHQCCSIAATGRALLRAKRSPTSPSSPPPQWPQHGCCAGCCPWEMLSASIWSSHIIAASICSRVPKSAPARPKGSINKLDIPSDTTACWDHSPAPHGARGGKQRAGKGPSEDVPPLS